MNQQAELNKMCGFTMAIDMCHSISGMMDYFYTVAVREDDAELGEAINETIGLVNDMRDGLLKCQRTIANKIIVKMGGNGDEEVQD